MEASNSKDSLSIVSYDPPLPAEFKARDRLSIVIDYTIGSVDQAQIFARPYTAGKETPGYSGRESSEYKNGNGQLIGWFEFNRPAVMDEVRVIVVKEHSGSDFRFRFSSGGVD